MDKQLDCDIVRDLLPSYVDGLTGAATNQAVAEHLEVCPACAAALARMREPEPPPVAATPAEVDYLKKVRRHGRRRSLLIAIALMLLGLALVSVRLFFIGNAAGADEGAYHVAVSGDTVTVTGTLTSSGLGVARVTFSDSNGIVEFRLHTALKTFFNHGEFSATYTAAAPVSRVRCGELIVWENGSEISPVASRLFAAANPWAGDMPANSRIADVLGVSEQFGPYSNELQTETEPYGWTLLLETPIAIKDESAAREAMRADSYAMLACIGNLGSVTWRYACDVFEREFTITAEAASAYAGMDIKECGAAADELQRLTQGLSFRWQGASTSTATGLYAFDQCLYMNPLSSYYPVEDTGLLYQLTANSLTIIDAASGKAQATHASKEVEMQRVDQADWRALFPVDETAVDVSGFSQLTCYAVGDIYRVYVMDDQLWLGQLSTDGESGPQMWSLIKLRPADVSKVGGADGPDSVEIRPQAAPTPE